MFNDNELISSDAKVDEVSVGAFKTSAAWTHQDLAQVFQRFSILTNNGIRTV
jgi:hypothetical protein